MFAKAFQVLRSKNWNVHEHFAVTFFLTSFISAINLSRFNIVKKMIFVSMSAKTLTSWSDRFTINSICISIFNVKPVFPRFLNVLFEFFVFLISQSFPTISVTNDLFIFKICLHMFSGIAVHYNSFHFLNLLAILN